MGRPTVPLAAVSACRITLAGPFSFKATVHKPSHFPTPLEFFADPDTYYFATYVHDEQVGVRVRAVQPDEVELTVYAPGGQLAGSAADAERELARRMGFLVDLSGYWDIWTGDPLLSSLSAELAGARPAMPHSLYGFLMICVMLQNTSIRRTVHMLQALLDRFSSAVEFPDGPTLPALWRPADILETSEDELRSLKLGYRARAVWKLSEQFAGDPHLDAALLGVGQGDALHTALIKRLYGVGPATAGYLGFAWFKELGHLVHISPWETKILSRLLFDRATAQPGEIIAEAKRRWAPFTMLALTAVFESVFWKRAGGSGPDWLEELILL